jgi:glycosyltransferase involved in cell wall biosynthesis
MSRIRASSQAIKVLMVAPSFPPYRGGVETHVFEVGRRLAADAGRWDVKVLTTDLQGRLPEVERSEGMQIERVPAYPRHADLYWSPEVYRRVRRADADIVHVQGYHTLVPPLAMLAAKQRGLPYVLTFHSGGHSSTIRQAIRPIQIRLLRPLLRGAKRLIAVSQFEAGLFADRFGVGARRIVTIPNGADLPPGSDPGSVTRTRDRILSIGRLERYKGHRRVIEAMPLIRARRPAAMLRILGDGPDGATLQAIAAEQDVAALVEIGGVPRVELPPIIRASPVVVLLSEYESHGLAVQEALTLGARVVVSDSSALAEVRELPQVIAIAPDAPADVIADAVVRQLEAEDVPWSSVPALPSWDACAESLSAVYERIVAERRH